MEQPPAEAAASMLAQIAAHSERALALAISAIENGSELGRELLERAKGQTSSHARRIGVTGPPGTGKSSLVAALAQAMRKHNPAVPVAVIAVDPSSPFSGGALLGDRYRMHQLAGDAGVFIRSMASRGALGGLSCAAGEACDLAEIAGYGWILVETVGVGQNEVDIASACDLTVVVLNAENGDSVQAMKAGLLDVADLVVVNKADHPRASAFADEVREGMHERRRAAPPVLLTVATAGKGIAECLDECLRLLEHAQDSGSLLRRRAQSRRDRIASLAVEMLRDELQRDPRIADDFERMADEVQAGERTAHAAARELVDGLLGRRVERFSFQDLNAALVPEPPSADVPLRLSASDDAIRAARKGMRKTAKPE